MHVQFPKMLKLKFCESHEMCVFKKYCIINIIVRCNLTLLQTLRFILSKNTPEWKHTSAKNTATCCHDEWVRPLDQSKLSWSWKVIFFPQLMLIIMLIANWQGDPGYFCCSHFNFPVCNCRLFSLRIFNLFYRPTKNKCRRKTYTFCRINPPECPSSHGNASANSFRSLGLLILGCCAALKSLIQCVDWWNAREALKRVTNLAIVDGRSVKYCVKSKMKRSKLLGLEDVRGGEL